MPFTFSHPAIVLPLIGARKKLFSATGLVVGSIIPDFEYFITLTPEINRFGHSIKGIFLFALPVALAVSFLFHNLVRNPLISNLPSFLNRRLSKFQSFNWNFYARKNILKVVLSILIGTISHSLWDSFTHDTGFFARHFSIFEKNTYFIFYERSLRVIIWDVSSVAGFITILLVILSLKPGINTKNREIFSYWFIVALVTTLVVFLKEAYSTIDNIGHHAIVTIAGILLGLIIASFFKMMAFGSTSIKSKEPVSNR